MNSRIHYTKPWITELEISYAGDAVRNGWGERCYEYIQRFEETFRGVVGAEHAIATSSCTGALHMGLAALEIGHGDEVILADTNWIATVAPVVHLGAVPVFVDILPDTWCIDPDRVEAAITHKTKAIIATHLYGNLCEMDALLEIADRHGIPIIEDAAEALGSRWHGRYAGATGCFGVFSFHGTKTVTTGEGGMFITNESSLYEKVLILSNHGRARGQARQFWPEVVGFKYKMSNIQAAIGCAQLERFEELIGRKREVFDYYRERLSPLRGIALNPEKAGTFNSYWMPTVVFAPETGITRDRVLEDFKRENIDARVFFHPLSSLPMFEQDRKNLHSYDIPGRAVNLPSYCEISCGDQDRVVAVIAGLL